MEFIIYKSSVISPLLSDSTGTAVKSEYLCKLSELKNFASNNFVDVYFFDNKVRFCSGNTRTLPVPKKCINSAPALFEWIKTNITKSL